MEVTADNFVTVLPLASEAIEECDFVSFDCEFTGLACKGSRRPHPLDPPAIAYAKHRSNVMRFLPIQIGLSCFTRRQDSSYAVQAFNL